MPTRTPHPSACNERGISLVELIVVMVIVLIIGSLSALSVQSARSSGQTAAGLAAGHAYANAIERFAREHNGRFPAAHPSQDWPDLKRGPAADVLGTRRYYLPRIPESVQDGSVSLDPKSQLARIHYAVENGGRGYRVDVFAPNRPTCALRGGSTTSTVPKSCTNR